MHARCVAQAFGQHLAGNVSQADLAACEQGAESGHQIGELANVARPLVAHEGLDEGGGGLNGGQASAGVQLGEVAHQGGDVFSALPQGWRGERQHIEPVIQVFPESAGLDLLFQVFVGGRHHTNIDLDRLATAHGLDHPFLDGPQQLDLHVQRQVADFVQEEGAAMGQLEAADPVGHRTGEGAALVAKEFALNQFPGNGPAVHRYEVLFSARRAVVQGLGHQFLSGATFPNNQHGGV